MIFRKLIAFDRPECQIADLIALARKDRETFFAFCQQVIRAFGGSCVHETFFKMLHHLRGAQFVVQKDLSDELQEVDFVDTDFTDIPWPADSVEFYFEDPFLASILLQRSSEAGLYADLAEALWGKGTAMPGNWERASEPELHALCSSADGNLSCTACYGPAMWKGVMEGESPALVDSGIQGLAQTPEESAELHQLMHLALKVLAYSSIDTFKPIPVTRKQMGRGPRPGVCGRPERPSFRTVFLPHVRSSNEHSPSTATGTTREFRGRRGHIRHFKKPYFRNLQGSWRYMRPIRVEGLQPRFVGRLA